MSFIETKFPTIDLPLLNTLQSDTTAYVLPRQPSEEAMLDEIERHYLRMLRHEIIRWFGDDIYHEIGASFLDFLCCFKFEIHSQILLMETSITQGHQLLCIKPHSVLLKWMQSSIEDLEDFNSILDRVNLSHLVEDSTVVVKNFKRLADVQLFLNYYYRLLYKAEMTRMCDRMDQWPMVDSFQKFKHYFSVEIHTQLVHLQ